MISLSQ